MEILKEEFSCGCIVVNDGKVLLVQHRNGEHWDFPKGHIENGETKKETAIREVLEETGIKVKVVSDYEYKVKYETKPGVQKTVTFFEAEVIDGIFNKQEKEILNIEWVPVTKALERITYDSSKEIFKEFCNNKNF